MPNHVDQDLFIRGNVNDLTLFIELAKDKKDKEEVISADSFLPYPEEFAKLDDEAYAARMLGDYSVKDGFNHGGYEWCCKHWGTKWGIYSSSLKSCKSDDNVGKLKYNFQSAWEPAILIIDAMSKQFPKLTFKLKYYERGRGFKGIYKIKNSVMLTNIQLEYSGKRGG